MTVKIRLKELAQSRSGDKGNTCNIGLIAKKPQYYPVLQREVTAEKVKKHFGDFVRGEVARYEMANIDALNFVLYEALNGGAASSLRSDNLGKCFGGALLKMWVEVNENEL